MLKVEHVKQGDRVPAEAAALEAARHPGVVELVDSTHDTLRTRRVPGRPLSELGPLPPEEVAGLAAAVAATLADLHDLGLVHGGIEASHVIVAADGHPVLCSLGRGGEPSDDVAALGRLMASLAGVAGGDPLRARLAAPPRRRRGARPAPPAQVAVAALAAEADHPDPERRPGARALAAAIRDRVPGARLPAGPGTGAPPRAPGPSLPLLEGPDRPLARLRRPVAGAGAVGVVLATVWWATSHGAPTPAVAPSPPGTAVERQQAAGAPPGPGGPPPSLELSQGVLTFEGARYQVGQPGDTAAAGDWACRGRPTLVLLRPATGQLFTFDQWAEEGRDVTARPLGRVEGATGLRATDADGDGCHELEVLKGDGAAVPWEVPR